MRRAVPLLVAVLLTVSLWALRAAVVERAPQADAHPTPWHPSESWPGGKQFDPRLDQTVAFWSAGIPLKEVFGSIEKQTGVDIGFFPASDDNERICVNLYLNRHNPPTLRDLMAQLSWVTDCAFAFRRNDTDGDATYCLLATSIRDGTIRRLREETEAWERERRAQREARWADNRARVTDKLSECREVLSLSREELIERCKGKDDLLLLAVLEPERRATLEFVLALPEEDFDEFFQERGLRRPWQDWTSEQRSALRAILEPSLERLRREHFPGSARLQSWDWSEDAALEIVFDGPIGGGISLRAHRVSEEKTLYPEIVIIARRVNLVDYGGRREPEGVIALREALGETLTKKDKEAIREEVETANAERWLARREETTRQALERRLAVQRPLSSEAGTILSDINLLLDSETPYPLWAVQEAVAATSGFHVVSDCFWQPARSLKESLDLLYGDEVPALTALLVLRLLSASTRDVSELRAPEIDNDSAGWDWEDAGRFLRFRSRARDLWRASFLPRDALERVDRWLAPYVDQAVESGVDAGAVDTTLDLSESSWLAARLDDFQMRYGGSIIYSDPADLGQGFLHILREAALAAVGSHRDAVRLLAGFSEGQWESLRGPGLRWDEDLTPDQRESARRVAPFSLLGSEDLLLSGLVTLGAPRQRMTTSLRGGPRLRTYRVKEGYPLEILLPDRECSPRFIPHIITVQLRPPSRLIEAANPPPQP